MNLPEKISAKDVEVCVLTFNRCALLKQALESLSGQTAAGFLVSVYDNASSDATPEVVEAAKKSFGENLKYVRHTENIGADANFHAALDGASRKYTMFMHDDDIANPNYLEYAIEAINIFGNVALLASDYTCIKLLPNSPAQFNHTEKKALVFNNQEEFAAYIFCDGRASYSSAIYRTEDLRKFNRPNIYGKIGDTPVMIDTSRGGKTVIPNPPQSRFPQCLKRSTENGNCKPQPSIQRHSRKWKILA